MGLGEREFFCLIWEREIQGRSQSVKDFVLQYVTLPGLTFPFVKESRSNVVEGLVSDGVTWIFWEE